MEDNSLALIMPVYNEEEGITEVLEAWVYSLNDLNINFHLHVYNDGSRDGTLAILNRLVEKSNGRIFVHDKLNSGHGPTVTLGYQEHSSRYPWILQVDSDEKSGAAAFGNFWSKRENFDLLIGKRTRRHQSILRKLISISSRLCVLIFCGSGIKDVNCPYRLMKTEVFECLFHKIPEGTFAPNVLISGYACKFGLQILEYPLLLDDRSTGQDSLKRLVLLKASVKSLFQTIRFFILLKRVHYND